MQPLLGDTFADWHIPMEMIGATTDELFFYVVYAEGL
jgi:hypothetical protein